MKKPLVFTIVSAAGVLTASTAISITEVAAWSSSSPVGADWFELTNTGGAAVTITGWKVDDSSNAFGSALVLNGITSIAPGESVIFIETANLGTTSAAFISTWFGANPPAGLQIGNYTGSMIGLSSSGDAVNIFDSLGAPQASVSFGASPAGPVFATFDNAAELTGAISQLSIAGVNGAFVAAGDPNEIGSPGRIGSPVPEPSVCVTLAGGIGMLAAFRRRRA